MMFVWTPLADPSWSRRDCRAVKPSLFRLSVLPNAFAFARSAVRGWTLMPSTVCKCFVIPGPVIPGLARTSTATTSSTAARLAFSCSPVQLLCTRHASVIFQSLKFFLLDLHARITARQPASFFFFLSYLRPAEYAAMTNRQGENRRNAIIVPKQLRNSEP